MPAATVDDNDSEMQVDDSAGQSTVDSGIPDYVPVEVPVAQQSVATYEENGPRLMISHIVNEFFKSYAGSQTIGPFNKRFTSIIGPNGSGKSNMIDSMLFVFGYRASKIRSNKLSVLIHNSDLHRDVRSCTVTVHFQKILDTGPGDDEFDVIPGSQFCVSRTAFTDNSSHYQIDGKRVQYREVAALLRGNGIDLDHNRFLILQGEVEQIAMMKPKGKTDHEVGMLEFLEDIVGTSRYKKPIAELATRVEDLATIRQEKLNRVKAVEKEKDSLEGARNEAIEFLTMENSVFCKKHKLYQKYIYECTINEEKATVKRDKIKEGMTQLLDSLQEICGQQSEKNKAQKKIFHQYEKLSKRCESTKEQFSAYEQQDLRCREDLKHVNAKAKKLTKSQEQERKKLEELQQIPAKMEADIGKLRGKMEKLEGDKAVEEGHLQEVMASLKTETQGLQVEKEEKDKMLVDLQKGLNETRSKYTISQSELDLFISNQQREAQRLSSLEDSRKATADKLKALHDTEKALTKSIPEFEANVKKVKSELKETAANEASLAAKVKSCRVKVEDTRSSMSASQSRGKVLSSLMELKRNGTLPGIYGRMGDLGAIDDRYDVAISTACGALDNIVVDNMTTAQRCVEFLKKNNVGVATFIGLDKMQRWKGHCERKITTPERVPRLFDLVRVQDPSVRPAFYFSLRDTLVADDLEQATRIAYGKTTYRVVTLTGQLIDQSGTMSGGGGKVSKGRMGCAVVEDVDPKQLTTLEKDLNDEMRSLQQCRDSITRLEETGGQEEKDLTHMKHNLTKLRVEIKALVEKQATLERQLEQQRQQLKAVAPDEKRLAQLERGVAANKQEFENAAAASRKVEDEVHALQAQILEIGGLKLKSVETRLSLVVNQIDKLMGQVTKANVAIKTAQRNSKKTEDRVTSMEEDIKENETKKADLETEFKQLEVNATEAMESYQQAQEDMKSVETSLAEIKGQLAALQEVEQKLQKENIEVTHDFEKYDAVVKDNHTKVKHWSKELERIVLHTVDRDEPARLERLSPEQLERVSKEETQYQITVMEERIEQLKPNMAAIEAYHRKEEQYLLRVTQLDGVTELRDAQRRDRDAMCRARLTEFLAGFSVISLKLKEIYQMITLGGDAELELVDSLDPFSEGIVFSVRPLNKSWKCISNLSGGEKTLSSLALVFALHHYRPTPLYVMDEIDAALDFKNVSIVGHYIKERTANAQFIIISLRQNMFELSDRLIGIFKRRDCTESTTIDPKSIGTLVHTAS